MFEFTIIDRVLNKYHTIHSVRPLYKLMNTYWETDVFRIWSKIWNGVLWKNNYSLTIFAKNSILNLWEGSNMSELWIFSKYFLKSCEIVFRPLFLCGHYFVQYGQWKSALSMENLFLSFCAFCVFCRLCVKFDVIFIKFTNCLYGCQVIYVCVLTYEKQFTRPKNLSTTLNKTTCPQEVSELLSFKNSIYNEKCWTFTS